MFFGFCPTQLELPCVWGKISVVHLINDPWLPVRGRDGSSNFIRPCDLVRPDIVDVNAPRADLVIAARTFLIGLLTTAGLVGSETEWQQFYANPPNTDVLMASLQRFAPAFHLIGDDRRFCQHSSAADSGNPLRIASLLIDGPNEESDERNHDVMTDVVAFSPSMCALALYAAQQFAGSGGRGHLQSMRRGSPMATLVNGGSTLWHSIWLNVETREQVAARNPGGWPDEPELSDVFPWLGTPRLNADKLSTTTSQAHPLQVYWQMPSLLWIESIAPEEQRCGLTGVTGKGFVTSYRKMSGGIKYTPEWRHPHTPHVRQRDDVLPARASARASRIGDWLGVVYRDQNGDRQPAAVVTTATTHRVLGLADASPRVDVFGFEMKNKKVLGIISHVMPIIAVEPVAADELRAAVEKAVVAAEWVANSLRKYAWAALVGADAKDAARDTASIDSDKVRITFLSALERHVVASILGAAAAIRAGSFDPSRHAWDLQRQIRGEAEAAFDAQVPTDAWIRGLEQRVTKRWELSQTLIGRGKAGAELFAILELPTPLVQWGNQKCNLILTSGQSLFGPGGQTFSSIKALAPNFAVAARPLRPGFA